jgi:hypothetical protein
MSLVFETFSGRVGETFVVTDAGAPHISLVLDEASLAKYAGAEGVRPGFSLVFVSKNPEVLPQRTYRLDHTDFEALDIFLVPIGRHGDGVAYQAVFN